MLGNLRPYGSYARLGLFSEEILVLPLGSTALASRTVVFRKLDCPYLSPNLQSPVRACLTCSGSSDQEVVARTGRSGLGLLASYGASADQEIDLSPVGQVGAVPAVIEVTLPEAPSHA